MFKLPRSSWDDYDRSLISAGGGIYPRSAKTIALSPEARASLGIDEGIEQMSPAELMNAILKAPVDLLWNGGIGTYVKASTRIARRRRRPGQQRPARRWQASCAARWSARAATWA